MCHRQQGGGVGWVGWGYGIGEGGSEWVMHLGGIVFPIMLIEASGCLRLTGQMGCGYTATPCLSGCYESLCVWWLLYS